MSAFSPALGLDVFTQVQLSTNSISTSASYLITGVPDGVYQVFPPYLSGFEASLPGPQSVTVHGSATLNVNLNQVTGKLTGTVKLPAGQSDYPNVHLTLQGPYQQDVDLGASNTYTLNNLGTGNYTLAATYKTTGAQVRTSFILSNGQTLTQNLDLSAPTYSISGSISIQNAFSIRNSSNSLVSINTLTDLLNNATSQVITLNASIQGGNAGTAANACSGGTPTTVSTVRVEAFPKDFFSYGNSDRKNLNNCFGVGQYKYGVVDSSGNYTISKCLTDTPVTGSFIQFSSGYQDPKNPAYDRGNCTTNQRQIANFTARLCGSHTHTVTMRCSEQQAIRRDRNIRLANAHWADGTDYTEFPNESPAEQTRPVGRTETVPGARSPGQARIEFKGSSALRGHRRHSAAAIVHHR